MLKLLFGLILSFFLLPLSYSYGFSSSGEDCSKCHILQKQEAADLLEQVFPYVKIIEVRIGPARSLWEVVAESNGKKGIIYLDFSKRYLFSGMIIDLKERKNLTQERFTEINRVDVTKIPLDDALVMGDKAAANRVIVFDDPDCPYCARLHQEMKKIVNQRRDIVFFIKMYPLPMHKEAYGKSKAIVCEKSLELLENAFDKKPIPEPKCETQVIDENIRLASELGITGTPAMIMPNGTLISGYMPAEDIMQLVDKNMR